MKIELYDNLYKIFILKLDSLDDKNYLIKYIKDAVFKLQHLLSLTGFYKAKLYPKEKIGLFIELIKVDEVSFSGSLDLRVYVIYDEDIYYKTCNYDIIKDCNNVGYIDDNFYCIVDNNFDNILSKVEFGNFIFGEDVKNIVKKIVKL